MKRRLFFGTCMLCIAFASHGQDINWRSPAFLQKNTAAVFVNGDYALAFAANYAHRFGNKSPIWVGTAWSIPFGKTLLDDWKIEWSAQREIWHGGSFSASIKPHFVLRRYESAAARLQNLGMGATATIGFFRPGWSLAAEAGYEGNLGTHIKHGELKAGYAEIRDGWYGSTGGNLKFGIKTQVALRRNWGLFLKAGKPFAQNFGDNPTLPFYADLGVLRCW